MLSGPGGYLAGNALVVQLAAACRQLRSEQHQPSASNLQERFMIHGLLGVLTEALVEHDSADLHAVVTRLYHEDGGVPQTFVGGPDLAQEYRLTGADRPNVPIPSLEWVDKDVEAPRDDWWGSSRWLQLSPVCCSTSSWIGPDFSTPLGNGRCSSRGSWLHWAV